MVSQIVTTTDTSTCIRITFRDMGIRNPSFNAPSLEFLQFALHGWLVGAASQPVQCYFSTVLDARAFCGSYIIIALIDCVPGFEVLAVDKHISQGLDMNEVEEFLGNLEYPDEVDYTPTAKGNISLE